VERRQSHVQPRLPEDFRRQTERSKKQMKEETMTLSELKEYIRDMPEDEILTLRFEEEDDYGRDDRNDGNEAV
jgi:hypothetical protein